ncbi:MAG: translesion DNA synthesis-associated protein ImuA [Gammaproteobacteria bacterium]|nr:translesion DNA synthesis-associated protein ImuA [Gammaproteobacteria bacterium]
MLAQALCRPVDKGGDKNIVAFTSHPWPLLITPHQLLNHLFFKKILITIEVPDSTSPSPSTTRYCTPGVHNLMEKRQLGLRLFTGSTCINKNTVYTYSYQDALMNPRLQALLTRPDVWQASQRAANEARNVLPTGHTLLDSALHQGGWPHAALTELLTDGCGIGEMQLLAPALAHCSRDPRRLFFLSPPYLPYAPSLHALGLRLERLQLVSAQPGSDTLWCAEQILRSGACSCLLAWLPGSRQADYPALRRLQLAARASSGPAFWSGRTMHKHRAQRHAAASPHRSIHAADGHARCSRRGLRCNRTRHTLSQRVPRHPAMGRDALNASCFHVVALPAFSIASARGIYPFGKVVPN